MIAVRPIEPGDKAALAAAFERLSAESRYRRFLSPHGELSAAELRYLTEVDHHDHEALVALDPATGEGVGVARYVRDRARPESAEIAVAADRWQGRGVGTLLLHRLVDRAREEGIRRSTASCWPTTSRWRTCSKTSVRRGSSTRVRAPCSWPSRCPRAGWAPPSRPGCARPRAVRRTCPPSAGGRK